MYSDQNDTSVKHVITELEQLIIKDSDGTDLFSRTCQVLVDV